jgi:hypothetical protein
MLDFMQVWLGLVTLTNCKFQHEFQQSNYYQLLHLTSSTYFHSAVVIGSRNNNSQSVRNPAH